MKTTRRIFIKNITLGTVFFVVPRSLIGNCSIDEILDSREKKTPTLIVDIDFNDEVIIRPEVMREEDVENLVYDLYNNGVDILLVRMGYLGYLPYHTDLSYPVGFDEEHARRFPFTRKLDKRKERT